MLLSGPNGIGKSTLLERLASGKAPGATVVPDVPDWILPPGFSNLDFEKQCIKIAGGDGGGD